MTYVLFVQNNINWDVTWLKIIYRLKIIKLTSIILLSIVLIPIAQEINSFAFQLVNICLAQLEKLQSTAQIRFTWWLYQINRKYDFNIKIRLDYATNREFLEF